MEGYVVDCSYSSFVLSFIISTYLFLLVSVSVREDIESGLFFWLDLSYRSFIVQILQQHRYVILNLLTLTVTYFQLR
jgi:hypothetical protein